MEQAFAQILFWSVLYGTVKGRLGVQAGLLFVVE